MRIKVGKSAVYGAHLWSFWEKVGNILRRIIPIQFRYTFINKLVLRVLLHGLVLLSTFQSFHLVTKPHDMTGVDRYIDFIAKHCTCIATYDLLRAPAPALWRHDQGVSHQNMALLPIC